VLDAKDKKLIRALVTVHVTRDKVAKTDFLEGKGEGLIMLLHGGPGTGKTLTAESVAEIAERPLYRVTCGDVGTDAESVERYLKAVLDMGTRWGSVVLLDEADIFLEERSKMDLQRNALVSVFLRVLEYYSGILILTTNRIGLFDEAFKSRINLSLHYPKLNAASRERVWRNFGKSLEARNEIDKREIEEHADELAKHDLNGRQIRNVINIARDLAVYDKKALSYEFIDAALTPVIKFEHFLSEVQPVPDEERAREMAIR
jgi:AAA+ superfamily predicted ATPase